MPTETVYGLAASIRREDGLKQIFAIKERPFFDPLIVHIADLDQINQVAREFPPEARLLAQVFWPGPLTMVLPKHASVPGIITAGLDTVGVRMPKHPIALDLIRLCGVPLAAPSANKFGKTSPTRADHVHKSFEKEQLFVLEGGQSEVGVESTVVSFGKEGTQTLVTILRPGAITEEMLKKAFAEKNISVVVKRASSNASPGNTEHHYMPSIPLIIMETSAVSLTPKNFSLIHSDFCFDPNHARPVELHLDSNPKFAARELYVNLRQCSESGADYIYVLKRPEETGGLWEAIWDRLHRAASRAYKL